MIHLIPATQYCNYINTSLWASQISTPHIYHFPFFPKTDKVTVKQKRLVTLYEQINRNNRIYVCTHTGSPGGSDSKDYTCNVGDPGSSPGLGRSPEGRHSNPLQYSRLESQGQRSLAGHSPRGHKESDMTEQRSIYSAYTDIYIQKFILIEILALPLKMAMGSSYMKLLVTDAAAFSELEVHLPSSGVLGSGTALCGLNRPLTGSSPCNHCLPCCKLRCEGPCGLGVPWSLFRCKYKTDGSWRRSALHIHFILNNWWCFLSPLTLIALRCWKMTQWVAF